MGISRNVVPCDALSSNLKYPTKKYPVDSLNDARTKTVMDEAYHERKSLCNVFYVTMFWPLPTPRPIECNHFYPVAAAAPAPPPPPPGTPPPSGAPSSCDKYVDNSVLCTKRPKQFGFFAEQAKLDQDQTTALKACAQTFCDKWPSGGRVKQASPPPNPHRCSLRR